MDIGEQMSLLDYMPEQVEKTESGKLQVVNAVFEGITKGNWKDLFEGYNELFCITFSSGIQFIEKIADMFDYVEIIFGCEDVISDGVSTVLAVEQAYVETIAKSKSASYLAKRIEEKSMEILVSRDTKSHEKIYILKSNDGRTKVICGSANMSYSAFGGVQRENIVSFDNREAYDYYKELFDDFKGKCADQISSKVLSATIEDSDYVDENIEKIPLLETAKSKMIFLEEAKSGADDIIFAAQIKGHEEEIKKMLPKKKKETNGKIIISDEITKALKRQNADRIEQRKVSNSVLPRLHIDYDTLRLLFNDKEMNLHPESIHIIADMKCFNDYMNSFSSFYGDWENGQKTYFSFMNWYFASIFMPYLRYVGENNNFGARFFPVYGILYGESDGGKSSFTKLLSKLMCGVKIPLNDSNDFTSTSIEKLKRVCEGIPVNIDDLAKNQYEQNYEKIIKNDNWGIGEGLLHYPSVAISTNKIPSLKSDISKRCVSCYIGMKLDKETGAKNSKRINESMHQVTTAFYCEYVSRMFVGVSHMVDEMKSGNSDYFPDIFECSSKILLEMFEEYLGVIPSYVSVLTYHDYFGDEAVGRNSIEKFMYAWENDRKNFIIDRKRKLLKYSYGENGRSYELKYMEQELPPKLGAKVIGSILTMKLDKAEEFFGIAFRKKIWER